MIRAGRTMSALQARARAFTLVEILLAVLILAFGLLGLGAVIPVVLREQRIGSDATLGVAAAKDARAYLQRRPDLLRVRHPDYYAAGDTDSTDYRMGIGRWLLARQEGTRTDADDDNTTFDWSEDYLWEDWSHTSVQYRGENNDYIVGDFTILPADAEGAVTIKLVDRLWPAPSATGAPPQFVWDFAARRVRTELGEPRKIQVVLFVRRIDPNIRVPRGENPSTNRPYTLYDVLAAGTALPVAVDRGDGLPVPNGNPADHAYAAPQVLEVTFNPQRPDRIRLPNVFTTGGGNILDAVRQPGQKIVDNLGNVYTVRGVSENDPQRRMILIDPPVPVSARNDPGNGENHAVRQIIFTPQIPAAVTVFTLTPVDPS